MSRKRRVFDIDMPDEALADAPEKPVAEQTDARRGPMASAIAENAEALQERKTAAQAIREENDALAHEYVALRDAGYVVETIPLDDIQSTVLVRDRMAGDDPELEELVTSIREIGLSNPIRVMQRPDGAGYELVQGHRRLCAYRQLLEETRDEIWAVIPALIIAGQGDDVAGLYRRMVDENVIRKDLSFAEMAHAAQAFAADPSTGATDLGEAVAHLFQSAAYSKRSYIKLFAYLLDQLQDHLNHPTAIPRALGIKLARRMKDQPGLADMVRKDLRGGAGRDEDQELEILQRHAGLSDSGNGVAVKTAKRGPADPAKTKTTFHIATNAGRAKCTAAMGRLEIRIDRDFSAIDRKQLEAAVAALVDGTG